MLDDFAGNTLGAAKEIPLNSNPQNFTGTVSPFDPLDCYSFTLSGHSSFDLSLDLVSASADVDLLNSTGEVLQTSGQLGSNPESLVTSLNANSYYITVYSGAERPAGYNNLYAIPNQETAFPPQGDTLTGFGDPRFETGAFTVGSNEQVNIDNNANSFFSASKGKAHRADFNGDGKTDFIRQEKGGWAIDNYNSANLYLSNGDGTFSKRDLTDDPNSMKGDDGVNLIVGDFNGDGKDDFIRQEKGGWDDDDALTAQIYLSKGDGTFSNELLTDFTVMKGDLVNLIASTPSSFDSDSSSTTSSTFNIQFDYRFDTNGWFTPERREALEAAATIWENIIQDEFANVPVGTSLYVRDPQTNTRVNLTADYEIDDLVVFVGARSIGGGTLANGGPSATYIIGSSLDTRYNGSDFEPWTGSISFDTSAQWFFDSTPATSNDIPSASSDFISVAVHELGHILGFSSVNAFNNLRVNDTFTGTNARAYNGSNPIPLVGGTHILDGYEFGSTGETAMDPSITSGRRKLPTVLDIAILDDIGYTVNYNAASQNLSSNSVSAASVT